MACRTTAVYRDDHGQHVNCVTEIHIFVTLDNILWARDSSVGISTESRVGRSADRIPVGRGFPPVQASSGAHPASCKLGTGSFAGGKYGRGVLLTPHSLLVSRSWESRAITLPTFWSTPRPVTGTFYLKSCFTRSKQCV